MAHCYYQLMIINGQFQAYLNADRITNTKQNY